MCQTRNTNTHVCWITFMYELRFCFLSCRFVWLRNKAKFIIREKDRSNVEKTVLYVRTSSMGPPPIILTRPSSTRATSVFGKLFCFFVFANFRFTMFVVGGVMPLGNSVKSSYGFCFSMLSWTRKIYRYIRWHTDL
jgi:hypothetical protein